MWNKPLPQPTETSRPFWDALKQHRVRLQQCEDCARWVFYPRAHCPGCASRRLAWRDVSGAGTLYTYTVARVPTLPEFTDEMPQLLAVVQMDEGPHLNSTLVGVAPEALRIGQRLRPVFDDRPGTVTLLRHAPLESDHPDVIAATAADAAPDSAAPPATAATAPPRRQVSCRDLAALQALVGEQWSDWSNPVVVSQALIDEFAKLSGDDYWLHTDPVRAKADSPFGTTIAHGMLVQALASRMTLPLDFEVTDFTSMVNYGSDRLRFAAPVPAGCRIQARCRVKAVERAKSGVQMTLEIATHVVGSDRPSVLNEQVILYL